MYHQQVSWKNQVQNYQINVKEKKSEQNMYESDL